MLGPRCISRSVINFVSASLKAALSLSIAHEEGPAPLGPAAAKRAARVEGRAEHRVREGVGVELD